MGLNGLPTRRFFLAGHQSSSYGGSVALNIKDPETDRLARELAAATGESITVAARRALEERLLRVRARAAARPEQTELDELVARARARATRDERTPEEILGYDERGLPA